MDSLQQEIERESWKSRLGFVFAGVGSAVGLVNIWRFPYVVAENGGSGFILLYVGFLLLIGFPVLVSETLIGRTARRGPAGALASITGKAPRFWGSAGKGVVITGFIVSSFYSVVAGWIVGYFVQAVSGGFGSLTSVEGAGALFKEKIGSAGWCLGYHGIFMVLSILVLHRGVRKGIEVVNKWLMPALVALLVVVMIRGLSLAGGSAGMTELFRLDFSELGPLAALTALGHAFFTLSLGQGTMITYGSYLSDRDNIPNSCVPIVFFDTVVSLLAGVAVLSIVFAAGASQTEGFGLLFSTLPTVFAEIPGGAVIGVLFFLLVIFAALTSQTSAMEPAVSYLIDEKKWSRPAAVFIVGGSAFLLGVPSAVAFSWLARWTVGGWNFFEVISFLAMDILIPIGGLVAVLYVGWVWGFGKAYPYLHGSHEINGIRSRFLRGYLSFCIRFAAPVAVVIILVTVLFNAING